MDLRDVRREPPTATITVTVWRSDFHESPPVELLAFRSWLDEKIAQIPAPHRESASIDIFFADTPRITYWRPENRHEQAVREAHESAALRTVEMRERREYERLKTKFEGDEVTRELREVAGVSF